MNWNWACEQLLKGYKVTNRNWDRKAYLYMSITDNGRVVYLHHIKLGDKPYVLHEGEMLSFDWELYQEPKKWTKTQQYYAKKLIDIGAEYIACNKSGCIWAFDTKPIKNLKVSANKWLKLDKYTDCICNIIGTPLSIVFGNNVKWKDEEPTRLQDIANSEAEDED